MLWRVTLSPMQAGGPYTIKASVLIYSINMTDVMFGDVWMCNGQSNMRFALINVSFKTCSLLGWKNKHAVYITWNDAGLFKKILNVYIIYM